ncbi:MAG TPA: DUF4342 domain-containing protein, partial [Candidatus Peregrinibacteria bacterium]|nr:DUF4342 domain-containing protein [Candidatus Peregrinibacteria bacterium]
CEVCKVKGDELLKKIKEIIHEGNVRKIVIKNDKGDVYLKIPVSIGIVGVLIAPALAVIAAIVAMTDIFVLEIERKKTKPKAKKKVVKKKRVTKK